MPRITWISCGLVIAVVVLYAPVRGFQFLYYDDVGYLDTDDHVRQGLTFDSIRWAMTTGHMSNWHPLTWMSHMLDVDLFGKWAAGHHFTNVVLHAINAVLLLIVLHRMTGAVWRSAFVAAVFAVHPLAVESVAWIAERKNVLSTLFWLLTMLAYAHFADKRSAGRYALVFVLLALGLMSKPMLVTLPFVLLLLDVWPLGRVRREPWTRLIVEKLPLLGLAVAAGVVTLMVQRGASVHAASEVNFPIRAANAVVSYVRYVGKLFWPSDLMVFYPYPHDAAPGRWAAQWVAACLVLLGVVTVLALKAARQTRRRYLLVGWLWFLGTLVPVNGLIVQHGSQSMADRYMYVPLIGLTIMVAWGATDLARRAMRGFAATGVAGAVALIALAVCTVDQVQTWRDDVTLFEHAVAIDPDNWVANYALATQHFNRGDDTRAMQYMGAMLRAPVFGRHQRKMVLEVVGRMAQNRRGMAILYRAVAENPDDPLARLYYAVAFNLGGQPNLAMAQVQRAIELDPNNAYAHVTRGHIMENLGRHDDAQAAYRAALKIDPVSPDAHFSLALSMQRSGDIDAARRHAQKLADYDPLMMDKLRPLLSFEP